MSFGAAKRSHADGIPRPYAATATWLSLAAAITRVLMTFPARLHQLWLPSSCSTFLIGENCNCAGRERYEEARGHRVRLPLAFLTLIQGCSKDTYFKPIMATFKECLLYWNPVSTLHGVRRICICIMCKPYRRIRIRKCNKDAIVIQKFMS